MTGNSFWDDRDDDLDYAHIWFAVGDDRMQRTHFWNTETTMQTASATFPISLMTAWAA